MGQHLQQSRLEMSLEGAVWFGAEHKIYRQKGTQQPPEKGERCVACRSRVYQWVKAWKSKHAAGLRDRKKGRHGPGPVE